MRKYLFSFATTALLFVSSAIPAYAAGNFFQTLLHSITNTAERVYLILPGDKPATLVLQQVGDTSQSLKTFQINSQLALDFLSDQKNVASVKLQVGGPVQLQTLQNPNQYQEDMNINAEVATAGLAMTSTGELRLVNKNVYFKIDEVPMLPFLNLDDLKGKWLKTAMGTSTVKTSQMTPDQQAKLKDAFLILLKNSQMSSAKKETKNDHAVYVIDIVLPKKALADYLVTAMQIQGKQLQHTESLDALLNNISNVRATIWVDQSSFYVRHVELPLTYMPEKMSSPILTNTNGLLNALAQVNKVNMLLTVDLDQFNQPFSVEEPSDAQPAD